MKCGENRITALPSLVRFLLPGNPCHILRDDGPLMFYGYKGRGINRCWTKSWVEVSCRTKGLLWKPFSFYYCAGQTGCMADRMHGRQDAIADMMHCRHDVSCLGILQC